MQKPITETFEFFEYMHLISASSSNLLSKLWLIGNNYMQYLMKNFSRGLIVKENVINIENTIHLLKKFTKLYYLKINCGYIVNDPNINNLIACISKQKKLKTLKFIKYHGLKNEHLDKLPRLLTSLYVYGYNFSDDAALLLPPKLIYLKLNFGGHFTTKFLLSLPITLQVLKLNYFIYNMPLKIFEFKFLSCLQLTSNIITSISHFNCPNLTKLVLKYNDLMNIPLQIQNCTKLVNLDLSHNQISEIPENFFENFTNLQTLNLSGNHLSKVPISIFNCKLLKILNLCGNNFKESPEELLFANLTNLQILNLNSNLNLFNN